MARKLIAALVLALAASAAPTPAQAGNKTVAVTAIVEHPALDAARKGIEDALAAAGYQPGKNLELLFESAHGKRSDADRIARGFVERAPDVIVPISTPSAQAVARATDRIPVVFSAVTNPLDARLVADLALPGANVTGISDLSPIGVHLDLVRRLLPQARRLGVLHNPDEDNSDTLLRLLQSEAPARGLEIVPAVAADTEAVAPAAAALVEQVDAIYIPTGNTVAAAVEAVVEVGRRARVPVFAGDIHLVPRGALAALGFNYYDVGRQTGRMIVRVLEGEDPGTIPVEGIETTELYLNPRAASAMGVGIPDDLLARAKAVGD